MESFWHWLVASGIIAGDPTYYSSGRATSAEVTHAINTAVNSLYTPFARTEFYRRLRDTGAYAGDFNYYASGSAAASEVAHLVAVSSAHLYGAAQTAARNPPLPPAPPPPNPPRATPSAPQPPPADTGHPDPATGLHSAAGRADRLRGSSRRPVPVSPPGSRQDLRRCLVGHRRSESRPRHHARLRGVRRHIPRHQAGRRISQDERAGVVFHSRGLRPALFRVRAQQRDLHRSLHRAHGE